jgi:hypothetical protein
VLLDCRGVFADDNRKACTAARAKLLDHYESVLRILDDLGKLLYPKHQTSRPTMLKARCSCASFSLPAPTRLKSFPTAKVSDEYRMTLDEFRTSARSFFVYLRDVIERVSTHPARLVLELTPREWKRLRLDPGAQATA